MTRLAIPTPILEILGRLENAGHETALVGRCVRELLSGASPEDFEALSGASAETLLRALPGAVVTGVAARRLTQPTAAGPLDLWPGCSDVEAALARRDFTLHAVAYRPRTDTWIDPHDGRRDLEAGRLRTPAPAKECFAQDPVRALRAARLVAQLLLEPDDDVTSAMPEQAAALARRTDRRIRTEIELLLMADGVREGLLLLRRTGLEGAIAPGTRADAAEVVARLPRDLELRLTGWLRGTRARAVLRELRCPRDRSVRVERLLQMHPVDAGNSAAREARARRLVRRPAAEQQALLALREAELGERGARRELDHLRRALGRARRAEEAAARRAKLALGGREVMEHLGIGPGARVGRALRFLTERVAEDPTRNEPAALRALLDAWAADEGDASARGAVGSPTQR